MEKKTAQAAEKQAKRGVADLFHKDELKKFFIRYLVLIGCLEVLIFFICFLTQLEPFDIPFPWKEYFFAAFTIPIAITFLLGIIIIAFNTYYFKDGGETEALLAEEGLSTYDAPSAKNKFFKLSWQFQFLGLLLALGIGAIIFYKLDDIFRMIGYAGERAVNIFLIILGILLFGTILLGSVFLFLHYLLRKKRMEYAFEFKREMISQTGMLLLDDNTIVNSEGKVIHTAHPENREAIKELDTEKFSLLPPADEGLKNIDAKN